MRGALRRRQVRLILGGKMKPDEAAELKALFFKQDWYQPVLLEVNTHDPAQYENIKSWHLFLLQPVIENLLYGGQNPNAGRRQAAAADGVFEFPMAERGGKWWASEEYAPAKPSDKIVKKKDDFG